MLKVSFWMNCIIVLFVATVSNTTVQAIAPVESRGEPLYEPAIFQSETQNTPNPSTSHTTNTTSAPRVQTAQAKQQGDRGLQTLNQIETLKQEVSELRGLIEVQDHEIKQLKKSQQDFYLDLEKKISEKQITKNTVAGTPVTTGNENPNIKIGKTKGIQIIPKGKETQKETTPAANVNATENADLKKTNNKQIVKVTPIEEKNITVKQETNTEKEVYDMAYSLVTSKQYDSAVLALQDFLVQYPRGEYSANANYWLGEINMVKWQHDKNNVAILDEAARYFTSVEKEFPGTPKVSDSLLKLGLISIEKGDVTAARRYFTDVKIKYPETAAARVAEAKLQQTSQN